MRNHIRQPANLVRIDWPSLTDKAENAAHERFSRIELVLKLDGARHTALGKQSEPALFELQLQRWSQYLVTLSHNGGQPMNPIMLRLPDCWQAVDS